MFTMMVEVTKTTTRRWVLNFVTVTFAVALALLYVLVLRSVAVQISPPPPAMTGPGPDISTQAKCEAEGGRWIESVEVTSERVTKPVPAPVPGFTPAYCQGPLRYELEREAQDEASRQTSLFVFAIGGALAVAGSLLIKQLKPVAPGLMLGGIASFFISGIQVWMLTPGIGRLVTIVVVFVVLIGVGLYAFRDLPAGRQAQAKQPD